MKKVLLIFFLVLVNGLYSQVKLVKEKSIRNMDVSRIRNDTLGGLSNFGNNTSNKNIKNENVKIEDYKIISVENDTVTVDTTLSIKKYFKYNYLRKDNFDLLPFTNMGQSYNTLSFDFAKNRLMPNFGARALHFSYKEIHDVNYYYVPTPLTELMYKTGFEQGQLLETLFTVNTSPQFNLSFGYKGLRSLGKYQHSLTSVGNFIIGADYKTKDNKYKLRAHLAAQDILNQQNGGLKDEDVNNFETGDPEFLDRSVFDPIFENAENFLRGNRYFLNHSYDVIRSTDSMTKNTLSVGNTFVFEDKYYKFKQSSPNDFFGDSFVNSTVKDAVSFQNMYVDLHALYKSHELGEIKFKLAYNSFNYGYDKLVTLNGVDIVNRLKGDVLSLGGSYQKKIGVFDVKGDFGLNISGDFTGNYVTGRAHYKISDKSNIAVGLNFNSKTPNYNFLLYQSDYVNYNWSNDFDNIKSKQLSLKFSSKKLFDLEADYTLIKNHTYFGLSESDSLVKPFQYKNEISYLRIKLNKEFKWYNFTLDNVLRYQKVVSKKDVLNIPDVNFRTTLYYTNRLFKKALLLQTGLSLQYFTDYYMNAYDPLLGEFYTQNDTRMLGFPRLDFFVNAKIRQTRIFLIAEHFNSAFTGYNYFSSPNYPYRDFAVRFGLVWNFFL
jgi:hypothetical protein